MIKEYGVLLVYSTQEAMKIEIKAKAAFFGVRIIPTPEKIVSSCGFSIRYLLKEEKDFIELLNNKAFKYGAFYHVKQDGLDTWYKRLEG